MNTKTLAGLTTRHLLSASGGGMAVGGLGAGVDWIAVLGLLITLLSAVLSYLEKRNRVPDIVAPEPPLRDPRFLITATAILIAVLAGAGCRTVNPDTGAREYDPVKTAQIKEALTPVLVGAVRRVVKKNPDTGAYFADAAQLFASMRDRKEFDPSWLLAALDRNAEAQGWFNATDSDWLDFALDAKNSIVGLYGILWNDRLKADLPEEEFLFHVADVFATVITQGVKEAGVVEPWGVQP